MVLADGSIRYTPAAGFLGRDRFRYRITDGKGKYESAWVSVTVQYRNRRSSYLETRPFTAQEGGARLHSSVMVL